MHAIAIHIPKYSTLKTEYLLGITRATSRTKGVRLSAEQAVSGNIVVWDRLPRDHDRSRCSMVGVRERQTTENAISDKSTEALTLQTPAPLRAHADPAGGDA